MIASYVGAKYACSFNSASSAIFLAMLNKNVDVCIPSAIPHVVPNMLLNAGNTISFKDDVDWVGGSYVLHDFGEYKIIDSAQRLKENQFQDEANPNDLMIFSFYPTKPVGSCDGGIIVSDDLKKISWFRAAVNNGAVWSESSWDQKILFPGWKMYMSSIQAYIGKENFKQYGKKLERIAEIRETYNRELGYSNTSDHLYRIRVKYRQRFLGDLGRNHIAFGIHYYPLHMNHIYNDNISLNILSPTLPKSERDRTTICSIPMHEKMDSSDVDFILKVISDHDLLVE